MGYAGCKLEEIDLGLPNEGKLASCPKKCVNERSACYKAGYAIPKATRGNAVRDCNPKFNKCYAGCKLFEAVQEEIDLGLPNEGKLASCPKKCVNERSACYKAGYA